MLIFLLRNDEERENNCLECEYHWHWMGDGKAEFLYKRA